MSTKYYLIVVSIFLVSCQPKSREDYVNSTKGDQVAILDSSTYSILKFDPLPFKFSNRELPKNSKPSALLNSEIPELENQLKKSVVDFNNKQKSFNGPYDPIDLTKYKRQLIVFINSNGEKEVLVNCFCSDEPNWKSKFVYVIDGGECYFNVIINLTQKKYYDFGVNSLA